MCLILSRTQNYSSSWGTWASHSTFVLDSGSIQGEWYYNGLHPHPFLSPPTAVWDPKPHTQPPPTAKWRAPINTWACSPRPRAMSCEYVQRSSLSTQAFSHNAPSYRAPTFICRQDTAPLAIAFVLSNPQSLQIPAQDWPCPLTLGTECSLQDNFHQAQMLCWLKIQR